MTCVARTNDELRYGSGKVVPQFTAAAAAAATAAL